MSRSIHATMKSVYGGKSLAEVVQMCSERDPDVMELVKKSGYKRAARKRRQRLPDAFDPADLG